MAKREFTTKQQKFIDCYCGNACEAALKAGYSKKTAFRIGVENMQKPTIAAAIKARQNKESRGLIMSRQERQAFWSDTAKDPDVDYNHRLRASELLGRSEADFIETTRHIGNMAGAVIILEPKYVGDNAKRD